MNCKLEFTSYITKFLLLFVCLIVCLMCLFVQSSLSSAGNARVSILANTPCPGCAIHNVCITNRGKTSIQHVSKYISNSLHMLSNIEQIYLKQTAHVIKYRTKYILNRLEIYYQMLNKIYLKQIGDILSNVELIAHPFHPNESTCLLKRTNKFLSNQRNFDQINLYPIKLFWTNKFL